MKELDSKIFNEDGSMIQYDQGLDYDGVLWDRKNEELRPEGIHFIERMQEGGKSVIINTARHGEDLDMIEQQFGMLGIAIYATNKKPLCLDILDDRATRYEGISSFDSVLRRHLPDDKL